MNKTTLNIALENLKRVIKQENVVVGIIVDIKTVESNKICFVNRENVNDQVVLSLNDLNK